MVARTIGMLAGLSALTAIALHRFYQAQARIGSPLDAVPESPGVLPGLRQRHHRAPLVRELHTIFAGAAVCAAVGGVLAAVAARRPPRSPLMPRTPPRRPPSHDCSAELGVVPGTVAAGVALGLQVAGVRPAPADQVGQAAGQVPVQAAQLAARE